MYYDEHDMNYFVMTGNTEEQFLFLEDFVGEKIDRTLEMLDIEEKYLNKDDFKMFGKETEKLENICISKYDDTSLVLEFSTNIDESHRVIQSIFSYIEDHIGTDMYFYNIKHDKNSLYEISNNDSDSIIHHDGSVTVFSSKKALIDHIKEETMIPDELIDVHIENMYNQ